MNLQIRGAIRKGLEEALEADSNVFLLGEDIGAYGGAYAVTDGFLEKFGPKRIIDTPISEAAFIGLATGSAIVGLKPIVELMSMSFSLVGFDQIVNMAANIRYMSGGQVSVPMVLRAPTGPGVQLAATHSQSFETWLAETPGLISVSPSTPLDALGLLRSSIKNPNPVIFSEPAVLYGKKGEVPDEYYEIPIGSADVKRSGNDFTIVSYGAMVDLAFAIADEIEAKYSKSAEIVDLRTLNPIDFATVRKSVLKTHKVVLLEISRKISGLMNGVVTHLVENIFDWIDAPILTIASQDTPWPYSSVLEQHSIPHMQDSVNKIVNCFDYEN